MNKMELISAMASEVGSTKSDAAKFLDAFISVIKTTLKNGNEIRLVGFGSFKVKDVPAKIVRNPQTGDKINVPANKRPKFTAGKELKDIVNNNSKK